MHCIFVINVIFTLLVCHVMANMEEFQKDFTQVVVECLKENPVTADEMKMMKTGVLPDSTAAKCLVGCAYKKTNMVDEDGKLYPQGVTEYSNMYFGNEPKLIKAVQDHIKFCLNVNDEPVGDGNKSCDRAALIFQCTVKFAPQFSYVSN